MVGHRPARQAVRAEHEPARPRPGPTRYSLWWRIVNDAAQLAVLVADRVEAVRAGRDDRPLAHPVPVERLDVLGRPASGRRTRCPSGGPGRRCRTPPGRGPRSDTPAASRHVATARATRRLRSSKAAAQPTQYRTSSSSSPPAPLDLRDGPDLERQPLRPVEARGGRLAPRVARRSPCPGTPAVSSWRELRLSSRTRLRRRPTILSTCSIVTGHASTQAPQVRQSQTAS